MAIHRLHASRCRRAPLIRFPTTNAQLRALVRDSLHDKRRVGSPEPERVGGGEVKGPNRPGFIGHVVEVALGIGVLVVDRRRQHVVANGQQADDQLRGPGGGDQAIMAIERLFAAAPRNRDACKSRSRKKLILNQRPPAELGV